MNFHFLDKQQKKWRKTCVYRITSLYSPYCLSCNNVALTDFGSWSGLQRDAISTNDAKQKFWQETKFIPESKSFTSNQHILRNKVFLQFFFQESNHHKTHTLPWNAYFWVWYVLMHLRGMVFVCDVSMVTEHVWNKTFTMKSTRTGS